METKDIIQSIGVITTIIFSLIALIQSLLSRKKSQRAEERAERANRISNEANRLARDALNESKKEYMPLIKFIGEIKIVEKDIDTLRNEITFDFYDLLGNPDPEYDELTCITTRIKNIGKGIVTEINIKEFFIQSGNEVTIKEESGEPQTLLCHIEDNNCIQEFILEEHDETDINFIISKKDKIDLIEGKIYEFFKEYENFMVSMSLEIGSINDSIYNQEFLIGTYLNKYVKRNSFSDLHQINNKRANE